MSLSTAAIRTVTTTPRSTPAVFRDELTLGIYSPGCFAPCAVIVAPASAHRGAVANWSRAFEESIPRRRSRQFVTLKDAAGYSN
jgi:hypothetical protein